MLRTPSLRGWKGPNYESEPRSCISMVSRCFFSFLSLPLFFFLSRSLSLATAYRHWPRHHLHAVLVVAICQTRRSHANQRAESSTPLDWLPGSIITGVAMIGGLQPKLSALGIPIHQSEAIYPPPPTHWLHARMYLQYLTKVPVLRWELGKLLSHTTHRRGGGVYVQYSNMSVYRYIVRQLSRQTLPPPPPAPKLRWYP